ncbi:MAG: DUF202 domain-containing protein [Candidatus Heimdallarchaeota archaeon]
MRRFPKNKATKQVYNVDTNSMIMRDHLAADRTALANERTLLSYIRTALALVAGGFGLIKFVEEQAFIILGWILVPIGVAILVFGAYRFVIFRRTIRKLGCSYNINDTESEKN